MVRFGNPYTQICRVSLEEQVSLIMMSRFGKMDYFRKIPLGTTTAKVAQEAKKPVLVLYTDISLRSTCGNCTAMSFILQKRSGSTTTRQNRIRTAIAYSVSLSRIPR